ncbi:hypothetical protein DL93DRAFT_2172572 [Clavulina sp. PMI_390]|nr:hypothetical protein DL93DRAFT_2172572 [Clavulina sp. PMI_390]
MFPLLFATSLFAAANAVMVHNITVGGNGALAFEPTSITASLGDVVQFVFVAKNHTATQSSFDSPCSRLIGADGVSVTGFDSGFQPVGTTGQQTVSSFTVTTTSPLWFYCRQTGHCAQGMVFAVNPPTSGNTFDKFLANALGSANTTATTTASTPPSTSTSSMITITTPAPTEVVTVTQTITLGASTWTTTYGSYPGSPDATPNVTPVTHIVKVGENGGLTFSPSNITAQPRDIVMFEFLAKNHTATQSSFANPCQPLANGFNSGFQPVASGNLVPNLFNFTVADTAPVWVYCQQTNPTSHCAAGMVFSVNAVESSANNFDAFRAKAMNSTGTGSTSTTTKSGGSTLALPMWSGWGVAIAVALSMFA